MVGYTALRVYIAHKRCKRAAPAQVSRCLLFRLFAVTSFFPLDAFKVNQRDQPSKGTKVYRESERL